MTMKKECVCGQHLEFEQEDAPYINCPGCGRRVSDLFDPATAKAAPEPLKKDATFARTTTAGTEPPPVMQTPPTPRAKGLFVIVGEETKGPYSLKQVKAMYESGQLTMDTMCCRDGDEQWRQLVELENEIFASDRQAMPPPIPRAMPANINISLPQVVRVAKARWVYIVLGLFLGGLGIHNFYAGYNGRGAAQLIITVLTFWMVIPVLFIGLWALIEICTVTEDAQGVPFA